MRNLFRDLARTVMYDKPDDLYNAYIQGKISFIDTMYHLRKSQSDMEQIAERINQLARERCTND